MTVLEETLLLQLRAAGLPAPEREYYFARPRMFRADFAYPSARLLIECEGGTWRHMGHSTGSGIARDIEKANLACLLGWKLLRFTGDMIRDGTALGTIMQALETTALPNSTAEG